MPLDVAERDFLRSRLYVKTAGQLLRVFNRVRKKQHRQPLTMANVEDAITNEKRRYEPTLDLLTSRAIALGVKVPNQGF